MAAPFRQLVERGVPDVPDLFESPLTHQFRVSVGVPITRDGVVRWVISGGVLPGHGPAGSARRARRTAPRLAQPRGGGRRPDHPWSARLRARRVIVADTGVGISRENLDKIFLPLFTTKARGIGLGLAISKSLAEASGGMLEAESQPGQGTRLTLTFPDLGDGAGDDRPA